MDVQTWWKWAVHARTNQLPTAGSRDRPGQAQGGLAGPAAGSSRLTHIQQVQMSLNNIKTCKEYTCTAKQRRGRQGSCPWGTGPGAPGDKGPPPQHVQAMQIDRDPHHTCTWVQGTQQYSAGRLRSPHVATTPKVDQTLAQARKPWLETLNPSWGPPGATWGHTKHIRGLK